MGLRQLEYGEVSRNGVAPIEWTKPQLKYIRDQYESGKSLRSIAGFFDLPTHSRIALICNERGWTRTKKNSDTAKLRQHLIDNSKKYLRMYVQPGWSAQMVAKQISQKLQLDWKSEFANVVNRFVESQGLQKTASEFNGSVAHHSSLLRRSRRLVSRLLHSNPQSFEEYKRTVRQLAYITVPRWSKFMGWRKGLAKGLSVDHIYSTYHGYYDFNFVQRDRYVPLEIICHPCNIQLISKLENSIKLKLCEITKKELYAEVRQFNKRHGNPFDLELE